MALTNVIAHYGPEGGRRVVPAVAPTCWGSRRCHLERARRQRCLSRAGRTDHACVRLIARNPRRKPLVCARSDDGVRAIRRGT